MKVKWIATFINDGLEIKVVSQTFESPTLLGLHIQIESYVKGEEKKGWFLVGEALKSVTIDED